MADKKNPNPVQTIEITNFGGRLTRIINGDMNSGFAKFNNSWGYDPFSKPMNLTWFEQPVDITGPITDTIIAAKKYNGASGFQAFANVQNYVLLLGNGNGGISGNIYLMQPNFPSSIVSLNPSIVGVANVDSVIGSTSVAGTYNFGGSMEIYPIVDFPGNTPASAAGIYLGADAAVYNLPLGSILGRQHRVSANYVGTLTNATGAFRPMKIFEGFLRVSNASTFFTIGAGETVTSLYNASIRGVQNANSDLQNPLPVDSEIQDMDVSVDGNYLLIATSKIDNEQIAVFGNDFGSAAANDSVVYGWNGADPNITTETTMPSINLTALQTYLGNNLFFSQDGFGSSITDGINKILTLPANKSPLANATAVNGNFLTWLSVENNSANNSTFATLYYFGGLDQENPPGLYRMTRISSPSSFVYNAPVNVLVDNYYRSVPSIISSGSKTNPLGYGKHYLSYIAPGFGGVANTNKLMRFLVNSTGTGTSQPGVYETQTQIFSKRITVKQIRIYTEPTVSGNSFQLDFIGSDGNVITNGTFNYTYVAGTDITQTVGSLERINFNSSMKDTYALAPRITNKGNTNMTVHKIEIDYIFSGK